MAISRMDNGARMARSPISRTRGNLPVRVLHVVGSLGRGGAETWLVQLLGHIDRRRVAIDVMTHIAAGPYQRDFSALGARVLCAGSPGLLNGYAARVRKLLADYGPFTVVHSHLQLFSGYVLRQAYLAGIPGRIAHFRNSADGRNRSPVRHGYRLLMRRWVRRYASHIFAVSDAAASAVSGLDGSAS